MDIDEEEIKVNTKQDMNESDDDAESYTSHDAASPASSGESVSRSIDTLT